MRRGPIIFAALIFLCSGCAVNRSVYVPYESKMYPAKTPLAPIVIADELEQPYEEMGSIVAYGRYLDGYDKVNELLKNQAREIGADAVIKVRYYQENIFRVGFILTLDYTVATGQGVAVRFKKYPAHSRETIGKTYSPGPVLNVS